MVEGTWTCGRCKQSLPASAFSPSQFERPGSWCRDCGNALRRDKRSGLIPKRVSKVCLNCGVDITAMRAHAKWCSSSCSAAGYRARNPEARRGYMLKCVYGITAEQYDAMFTAQGECCAICRDPNPVQWNVDHCHETGAVRGILCSACNQGIGILRDDPEILRSALRYLSKARRRTA